MRGLRGTLGRGRPPITEHLALYLAFHPPCISPLAISLLLLKISMTTAYKLVPVTNVIICFVILAGKILQTVGVILDWPFVIKLSLAMWPLTLIRLV